jgi:hypothetical protein
MTRDKLPIFLFAHALQTAFQIRLPVVIDRYSVELNSGDMGILNQRALVPKTGP